MNGGDGFCLLSCHGHILTASEDGRALRFSPITRGLFFEDWVIGLGSWQGTGGDAVLLSRFGRAVVDGWRVRPGSKPCCCSVSKEDGFLCAQPDGSARLAAELQLWENYFPVSTADLRALYSILWGWWHQPGNAAGIARVGLRVFDFLFGGSAFPLGDNNPISQRLSGGRLVLRGDETEICLEPARRAANKTIWIDYRGNDGNRALQYLTAEGIRQHRPDIQILNTKLEIWGIDRQADRPADCVSARTGGLLQIDVEGLADCLHRGEVDSVIIEDHPYCVEHYPARQACRALIPATIGSDTAAGFGAYELVCNIRGREILAIGHRGYLPLPAGYYRLLQEDCGLDLVFYGQVEDNAYIAHLRSAFPQARFISSQGPNYDFEVIRRSKNIAVSISTFSWLAAWLSTAERIYLPVGGLFNPAQNPTQCYIPVDETAYRYVLLPKCDAHSLYNEPALFWETQRHIERHACFIGEGEIAELLERAGRRSERVFIEGFDSEKYCHAHPEIATEVMGLTASALTCFLQQRANDPSVFAFDEAFYAERYPDAVIEVAMGRHNDLFDHFLHKGRHLGHQPYRSAS
jgi:hypothetical protein